MKHQKTKLSLHIRHPGRDLAKVCKALGLKPKHVWKKGEERTTPKGNRIGGVREDSRCTIEFGPASREPWVKQIGDALTILEPHRASLLRLASTGGRLSFFVGWFCDENAGEILDGDILSRMTRLRIGLDLNVYLPDQKE